MKDKFYCSICNSLQEAEKQYIIVFNKSIAWELTEDLNYPFKKIQSYDKFSEEQTKETHTNLNGIVARRKEPILKVCFHCNGHIVVWSSCPSLIQILHTLQRFITRWKCKLPKGCPPSGGLTTTLVTPVPVFFAAWRATWTLKVVPAHNFRTKRKQKPYWLDRSSVER